MPVTTQTAIIPAGQFLSSSIDASSVNVGIFRIAFPSAWTGNAWLTVQISADGVTWNDLYHRNGQPVVLKVIPGASVLVPEEVVELAYFRFRSGSALYPVPQTEQRTFLVVLN